MKSERVNISRREFLIHTSLTGAGFALGLSLPLDNRAFAAESTTVSTPEVNAWVVIEPDDTVIIRIARSEMGQGTLTGLAQLVAEELECDWSKVTTEYASPAQNLARDRVWGSFATGGSFDNGLPFSLSMGCGTWGKNGTSDNMNYRHYLNTTRIARTIKPVQPSEEELFGAYWDKYAISTRRV